MKWTATTLNLSKVRKSAQHVAILGRTFGTLTLLTACFFVVLILASYIQSKNTEGVSSISSMKGFAASLSSHFFMDMMSLEVPYLIENGTDDAFTQKNVLSFMFRILTDINTHDPKTLVAQEIPGIGLTKTVLLRKGVATHRADSPTDYPPSIPIGKETEDPQDDPLVHEPPGDDPQVGENGGDPEDPSNGQELVNPEQNKVVFIYHSHNQESFLPELPGVTNPDHAYHRDKNITLVGKKLLEHLEANGIGGVHSDVDYPSTVENFKYHFSYKYSLDTLKEVSAQYDQLQFFFDIHRDSQVRSRTTTTIDGVDYAQIYFILGEKNPNWKKNEQFASQIHDVLEEKYPGISKGIHAKSAAEGNAEYNQSFSPNSVIVEIGGPYNSLAESYRTVELLADAITDVVRNATKVQGSIQ